MGYGIGADLVAAFSHRRSESTKLVDRELVPRFQAAHGHTPNQRELAVLQEQATLRTRSTRTALPTGTRPGAAGACPHPHCCILMPKKA